MPKKSDTNLDELKVHVMKLGQLNREQDSASHVEESYDVYSGSVVSWL